MHIYMRLAACLGLGAGVCVTTAAQDAGRDWSAEIGAGAAYHDNFFHRGDLAPAPAESATVAHVYLSGERDFDAGRRKWTLFGLAEAFHNADIDDADTQSLRVGAAWRAGKTRLTLEGAVQPNLLYSEDGAGEYYDLAGASLELRYTLREGVWIGFGYEQRQWEFDASEAGRDADGRGIDAALRLPLGERAGLRLLGTWQDKDADDPNNDWDVQGFGLALEFNPSQQVSLFARHRIRERDYPNAPAGGSNLARDDDIADSLLNLRVRVGERWGVVAQVEHRDAESSRADRNFDATQFSLSVFVTL